MQDLILALIITAAALFLLRGLLKRAAAFKRMAYGKEGEHECSACGCSTRKRTRPS